MARPKLYQKIFGNNGLSNEIKHDALPQQDKMPSQSGQSGKFLTTDGSATSWNNVDALPSQEGQSGKFLTTDGSDASWGEVPVATQSANGLLSSSDFSKLAGIGAGANVSSVNGMTGEVSLSFPAAPSIIYQETELKTNTSKTISITVKPYVPINVTCVQTSYVGYGSGSVGVTMNNSACSYYYWYQRNIAEPKWVSGGNSKGYQSYTIGHGNHWTRH